MEIGDRVYILPAITQLDEKVEAEIIEVEDNPANGIVISARTTDGVIYFGPERYFEPII